MGPSCFFYYGQRAGTEAFDPALITSTTSDALFGGTVSPTKTYRAQFYNGSVESFGTTPPDATWSWTIGDCKAVDTNTLDFQLKLESSDADVVASYRNGMVRQDKLGANYINSAAQINSGRAGDVTITYAQDPATAATPDAASLLTVSTALSLITAASLALF